MKIIVLILFASLISFSSIANTSNTSAGVSINCSDGTQIPGSQCANPNSSPGLLSTTAGALTIHDLNKKTPPSSGADSKK